MNGPTPLPPWQADRLATLLDVIGDVPISEAERRSLAWLAGFEAATVENIAALVRRAQAVILAKRAARDEPEVRRLRGQLTDLCSYEGVDPGEDPHAALLAHLRRRREPPLHRPRPCPGCGVVSRAIIDGRCLACREPGRGQS